jgi:predicted DNA-binding antitoxin AbrB/MazE fold protein
MVIQGHYENGMIIPEGHLSLPNGTQVTIVVREKSQQKRDVMSEEERRRYLAALAEIDSVPDENPGDKFSGRDHDQALYGSP